MIHATTIGRVMSVAAAIAVLVSAPVLAANQDRAKLDISRDGRVELAAGRHYAVLDSNRDGRYSLEEVRATLPALTPKEYADFDVNLDGRVTKDELKPKSDRPGGQ